MAVVTAVAGSVWALFWAGLGAWLSVGGAALLTQTSDTLPVLYMENHCRHHYHEYLLDRKYVDIGDSTLVELTADPVSAGSMFCTVTFRVKAPYDRVLIHFESVDINYNPGTIDRLHLYDGYDVRVEMSPSRGLYGKYSKGEYQFSSGNIDKDYVSSVKAITLYFVGSPSAAFRGFRALLTAVKDSVGGVCPADYLHCSKTGHCVSMELQCNGYQNCGSGDTTDQDNCAVPDNTDNTTPRGLGYTADLGLMVGCAVSIVILMVVVLWLGIVCLKKTRLASMRQRLNEGGVADTVEGAVVEPSEIRRVMSPPVSFLEPPPLYSEEPVQSFGPPPVCRFELPPPYSVEEHDTAGLLLNETRQDTAQPDYTPSCQPHARGHSRSIQLNRVLPRRPYCPVQAGTGDSTVQAEMQPQPHVPALPVSACVRHPVEPSPGCLHSESADTSNRPATLDPDKAVSMATNIPDSQTSTVPVPGQIDLHALEPIRDANILAVDNGHVTMAMDMTPVQPEDSHECVNLSFKDEENLGKDPAGDSVVS